MVATEHTTYGKIHFMCLQYDKIFCRKETDADVENERHFFAFKVLDFLTVLNVGYNITKTTRMSYLLRDKHGSYAFMQPYVWNHLCYSFRRPGYSKAVLVSFHETIR